MGGRGPYSNGCHIILLFIKPQRNATRLVLTLVTTVSIIDKLRLCDMLYVMIDAGFGFERHLEAYDHLATTAVESDIVLRRYAQNGGVVLCAENGHLSPLDPKIVGDMLAQNVAEEERGIFNNCFDIARRGLSLSESSGVMKGWETSNNLIVWANHYINWMDLDSSVLAFDLTASTNIDRRIGNFSVLAIRAEDINSLVKMTALFYGGGWEADPRF